MSSQENKRDNKQRDTKGGDRDRKQYNNRRDGGDRDRSRGQPRRQYNNDRDNNNRRPRRYENDRDNNNRRPRRFNNDRRPRRFNNDRRRNGPKSTRNCYRRVQKEKEELADNLIRIGRRRFNETGSINRAAQLLLGDDKNSIKKVDTIVLSGADNAVPNTIHAAGILRSKIAGLYQINRIKKQEIVDVYEPTVEGLDVVEQQRELYVLEITLTRTPSDEDKKEVGFSGVLAEVKEGLKLEEIYKEPRQFEKRREGGDRRREGGDRKREGGDRRRNYRSQDRRRNYNNNNNSNQNRRRDDREGGERRDNRDYNRRNYKSDGQQQRRNNNYRNNDRQGGNRQQGQRRNFEGSRNQQN